jgi:outer membrane receptor protein involved in Fe transport
VDSVTHFNPLNHPANSVYGSGTRGKYDLSVSGGSEAVRYYVAGGLSNETGVARLPDVFHAEAQALGFPASALKPNTEGQRSLRANTAIRLGQTADLSVTAAYLSTHDVVPASDHLADGTSYHSPTMPADSAHNYGYGAQYDPLGLLGQQQSQQTDRLTGGMTANWRPAPWLVAHATVGVDHGSQQNQTFWLPQAAQVQFRRPGQGQLLVENGTANIYSADLRATATAPLTHAVLAVTSFGLQLADSRAQGVTASVSGLSSTNPTLNGAVNPNVTQAGNRSATLGGYVEEQLAVADRLFLTGALRVDAGSGFGYAYHSAAYPKASVSWLAVQQGAATLRLRGAFGESGVQPTNGAALPLYGPTVAWINGSPVSASVPTAPGNPNLRPERSEESEGGLDFGLWGNRVSTEVTGYEKTTHDALFNLGLGWDLNTATYQENIGEVRNTGLEASVNVIVVQSRPLTWDMTVGASVNHNTLVHLAPGVTSQYSGSERQAVGYPLYGYWGQRYQYADRNHDGIIEVNEVTVADSTTYMGSSLPTQEASVATHVALWHGAISVGALFDYRGGYRVLNTAAQTSTSREANDPSAPLWQQARWAAYQLTTVGFPSGYFEDGSFVRFRELSLTYALPARWAHAARVQSLSLTGAVRNLALWTRYTGSDPEVSLVGGAYIGTASVNNDVRMSGPSAVPLTRYWVKRLNVGI